MEGIFIVMTNYQLDLTVGRALLAFIGFAAQAKPARFESAGASSLHTLPFGFNPGDATGMQEIGV